MVLGALAAAATLLLLVNARTRIAQNDSQFVSGQMMRLGAIEVRIDDYFAIADQLVAAGAQTVAPLRGDTQILRRAVAGLFRARTSPQIFGLGPLYAPNGFQENTPLFSVYDQVGPGGRMVEHVDYAQYDYKRFPWWGGAVSARGQTMVLGPLWEDHQSFITVVQAFYRDGALAGVMCVDTLTSTFKGMMSAPLVPGDIAWIQGHDRKTWILGTKQLPKNADLIDAVLPSRYTHSYLHLSSDASALHVANRRIACITVILIVAVWFAAGVIVTLLLRYWRSRESTAALELERERLENEIAVGKKVAVELRKAAYTDELTGLPNRHAFLERAAFTIASDDVQRCVVMMVDLDRFNLVNETLGHLTGDELLKSVAERLRESLPKDAWVFRLGGDEYVVLVETADATRCAQDVLSALSQPFGLDERTLYTSASIGIVQISREYRDPEALLRDADIAMYEAKRLGRARSALFDAAMRNRVAVESEFGRDLRSSIERREFVAHYQPIVETMSCAPVSFEALARWKRPGGALRSASEFIGYAERYGLVDAIDAVMLQRVCEDAAAIFARYPRATVALNVSAAHLAVAGLATTIAQALRASNVAPERIKIEVTETAIMTNAERGRETLAQLRELGLEIVLDDFGTGQSSLAYLHRLPIAGLKIDRSFIAPLPGDAQAFAIVRSIVALAQNLGLYVVAEGVETPSQLGVLRQLGVAYAQGFLFSPPLDPTELVTLDESQAASS